MDKIIRSGRYLFALPLSIFGVMHLVSADIMAAKAPGGLIIVYITGLSLIFSSVSIFIGKYDKLACILLGFLLLLFIFPHVQGLSSNEAEIINILKNIALSGGAFMCASLAKDTTYVK